MANQSGPSDRSILIKSIWLAAGGENINPLLKVWLQQAKVEGSNITDADLQDMLRKKLGLPKENKEGGSGSNRR